LLRSSSKALIIFSLSKLKRNAALAATVSLAELLIATALTVKETPAAAAVVAVAAAGTCRLAIVLSYLPKAPARSASIPHF